MTSLVTRCPACSTHFKVVPDQLRISEGWVRCGQCDEVFDAQAHMQRPIEEVPTPGTDAAPSVQEPAVPAEAPTTDTIDAVASPVDEPAAARAAEPVAEAAQTSTEPEAGLIAEAMVLARDDSPPDNAVFVAPDPVLDGVPAHDNVPAETPRFAQSPLQVPDALASDFQASFLQHPTSSKPQRRWLRGVLLAVLGLLLLLQLVLQQRDRIAATETALAPGLQFLCQAVGCQLAPLRQIESIVIESSAFIKVKADVYRLSFSIKNTALVPLALPFAELTLTDLRDQSVLRRVLAPAEYGARAETLAPGEELTLVVPVAVKASAPTGDKVTGYRLLVFYP